MIQDRVSLMIIGDNGCGKTCLLTVFRSDIFPVPYYIPRVCIDCVKELTIDDKNVEVNILDTMCHEDFDKLRPLAYRAVNLVLVCYSVDSQTSYDNVKKRWLPEINQYAPELPVVLVALKKDLRDDQNTLMNAEEQEQTPVSQVQGEKMRSDIGAVAFLECSALKTEGVYELLETAVRIATTAKHSHKERYCCSVM